MNERIASGAYAVDSELAHITAALYAHGMAVYRNTEGPTFTAGQHVSALVEYADNGRIISWAAYRGTHHEGLTSEQQHWRTAYRGVKLDRAAAAALFPELPKRRYRS